MGARIKLLTAEFAEKPAEAAEKGIGYAAEARGFRRVNSAFSTVA
jgi:hypothetical protein